MRSHNVDCWIMLQQVWHWLKRAVWCSHLCKMTNTVFAVSMSKLTSQHGYTTAALRAGRGRV